MQFGPFNQKDLPRIEPVLKELGIDYTVSEDLELLEQLRVEFSQREFSVSKHGPAFQPAYISIDFPEEDLSKIGDRLEAFGITAQTPFEPDFDADDYFCPTCGNHSIEPGFCKQHQVALIKSEDYKKLQQEEEKKGMQSTWRLVIIVMACFAAYWIYNLVIARS